MPYLLNLCYLLLLLAASPWLVYRAVCHGKYRAGWGQRLWGRVPCRAGDRPCVWFHAVSVGEVQLLATLLSACEQRWPTLDFFITTTTRTGFEVARQRCSRWTVSYAPLDFSWAVSNALRRIRPQAVVLMELEVWPQLIRLAKQKHVRVAIVNARLSENSYRGYQRLRVVLSRLFPQLDLVAAQNSTYAQRFTALGTCPQNVHVTGSIKFDGAEYRRDNPHTQRLARLAGLHRDDRVLLAGSTQHPEEALALHTFCQLQRDEPRLRLILVPRHPERFDEVARMLDRSGVPWTRRSRLDQQQPDATTHPPQHRVLLVDTVGELNAWWGTAEIAFVGGSLGRRGGQNMIEPAAYGAAVSFGPHTRNFRDVTEALLAGQAAVVVRDQTEFTSFVRQCVERPEFAAELGRRALELVMTQRGATQRTLDLLQPLVGVPQPGSCGSRQPRSEEI